MKFKLLLDEHINDQVAPALRRKFPSLDVVSIYETHLAGLPDPTLLEVLDVERRTLVTRDVNSIPAYVNARMRDGLTHAGVIFVDSKRLKQTDLKGLIRRLVEVVEKYVDEDWTCRSGWL